MNIFLRISALLFLLLLFACSSERNLTEIEEWPEITSECKPWTYWWWMGSAVDSTNLTKNLETLSQAGIGGVHVIPIYGVKGYEKSYIPYLSPEWMSMLAHTVSEAGRLDMGVDMTTGTGWPFGGPQIGPEDAASLARIETFECPGGKIFTHTFPAHDLQALMAYSHDGRAVSLMDRIESTSGKLEWNVHGGSWSVYALSIEGTQQQVKRAAPGAEGNVLDYFSEKSLGKYLKRFDTAFGDYGDSIPVRAFYNDSFEVYRSNWTDDLLSEFIRLRGYDLRNFLIELKNNGQSDLESRVRHDYNETVSDLLYEQFTVPWVSWAESRGSLTRSQAHGSPGNLLDLYAAADIPETEAFGTSGFPIPGLRIDPDMPEHFGKPDILVSKFASSVAHVTGKPLVSSESCTWLGEHFKVALSQIKPEIDALFVSGVNHVFFHGTAYSPEEAAWPGWLFYASTNFGASNTFHRDLPELTSYIARCQSFLQDGKPANDVLLYWPVHDRWRAETDEDMLHHFQVHNADIWLYGTPFHDAAQTMWDRGFTFDYVSDRMLLSAEMTQEGIKAEGGIYRTIVVPGCRFMPYATFEKLVGLAQEGADVVFTGSLPEDVPGLGNFAEERARFRELLDMIKPSKAGNGHFTQAPMGKGSFIIGQELEHLLAENGINREPAVDDGLEFVRRSHDRGYHYFFTNLSGTKPDGWVTLGTEATSAVLYDPLTGKNGVAAVRRGTGGGTEVYLQLEPGRSCILRTYRVDTVQGAKWEYLAPCGDPVRITGKWDVTFVDGGPRIPQGFTAERLDSWTESGGSDARIFGGTARYTTVFRKPSFSADGWVLDPGKVCESAKVWLNGKYLGAVWSFPFKVTVGDNLREGENTLEIEVTNLAANRIADLDRRGVRWKMFNDINYVNIKYEPFDASEWPLMESGLIGPVQLCPVKRLH